jgi:hypothetical protein
MSYVAWGILAVSERGLAAMAPLVFMRGRQA